MRFHPASYGLALVGAAVVLAFQIGPIRNHAAWQHGTASVLGHVDNLSIGPKVTEVDYSYEVNGKHYTGENFGKVLIQGPQEVTYTLENPAVSSIQPEEVGRLYTTACIIAIIGLLPLAIMLVLELVTAFKRRNNA
jgi:hypothetical protein